ncbi:MAG: hypothetical protein VXZ35_01385 [Pseudomonadota bacterium]|nr:hypothetical protein [Pseudomonadota bacterium]
MVLLLKRNHDLAVEKNELYRAQNQQLEKVALEKDRLYNEVSSEQSRLTSEISRFQRQCEELKSQCDLLDAKLKKSEESNKNKDQELKTLRASKNKFEGQAKVHSEQLDVI